MFIPTVPKKLKPGSHIRVIAPALSLKVIDENNQTRATQNLENHGFKISLSENANSCDQRGSGSIEERLEDLHNAFSDPDVDGIICAMGGYNTNEILRRVDYDLIKKNPKFFCGYSDITILQHALYTKSALITYAGPVYSEFGMEKGFDYSLNHFMAMACQAGAVDIYDAPDWSDDQWYLDQDNRTFYPNNGIKILQAGSTKAPMVGGNLGTMVLGLNTDYLPDLSGKILLIEDEKETEGADIDEFIRCLMALSHQKGFEEITGLIFGRFKKNLGMDEAKLKYILQKLLRDQFPENHAARDHLSNIPVIYNVDFGHTNPSFTYGIGAKVILNVIDSIELILHHDA